MTRGSMTNKRPGPLRRSASVASLPTPPRTTHKRKRGKSALSNASATGDSDLDDHASSSDLSSDEDGGEITKRRRLAVSHDLDAEADAFWLADGPSDSVASSSRPDSTDDVPLALKNFRLRAESSLASPPPSFRQKPTTSSATIASPPHTPPRSSAKVNPTLGPVRDSPSNPFLDSPLSSDEEVDYDPQPTQSSAWEEKPTITMIYRGTKKVFANPNYDTETGRSKPVNPNSLLDPSHPDFEPDFRTRPTVLFPKRKKKKDQGAAKSSQPQQVAHSLEEGPRFTHGQGTSTHVPYTAGFSLSDDVVERYLANIAGTPV